MEKSETEAFEEYTALGVELPEDAKPTEPEEEPVEVEPKKEPVEEPVEEKPEEKKPKEEEEEITEEPQQQPKKRSIYDAYKDKKKDLNTEKELREAAEQELKEANEKLEAFNTAETPAEKKEAANDLDAFATEIGADPAALKRMQELFLKDLPKSEIPEGFQDQMKQFTDWQKGNNEATEAVAFEKEFKTAQPELAELFPNATAEATEAIKAKIQELAHTDAYHDKEVAYIAFKNRAELSALVSPKKRGLESKGKGDAAPATPFKFDPNADLSTMSAKDAEAWEADYRKATTSEGLATDAEGRRILL